MIDEINKLKIDILLKELDTYNNQNIYKYLLECIDLEYTKNKFKIIITILNTLLLTLS